MSKTKIIKMLCVFMFLTSNNFSQTLDQQLRQAQAVGQINAQEAQSLATPPPPNPLAAMNTKKFFNSAPAGISSLFTVPEIVEVVEMGYLTVYFPKGYGKNILHYGIWNAIPFVVFDNNTLELRFGLIFEHRQIGFVPDDWVSTSITGVNLPELNFLIPNSKTFLSFTQGSSQWRSTVLLTEEQIKNLEAYANSNSPDPNANIFTVNHRFIDSSARPYLIGVRHKSFFKIMLQIYDHISKLPLVQKFRGSDVFPAGAFFEELTIENVVTEEVEITEQLVDDEPEEDLGYYDDIATEYVDGEYDEEAGYYDDEYDEEAGYYDDEYVE